MAADKRPRLLHSDAELAIAMCRRGISIRALVIGDSASVARVLEQIRPHCRQPLHDAGPDGDLPCSIHGGTVILRDISSLTLKQQKDLLSWMTAWSSYWSLLATTTEEIFPLIERDAFLAQLFYRLNVVTIDCMKRE